MITFAGLSGCKLPKHKGKGFELGAQLRWTFCALARFPFQPGETKMDIKPPFSVNVDREDGRHIVTIDENGAVVSRETFSSQEEAVQYANDEIDRLSRKYAAMGNPHA